MISKFIFFDKNTEKNENMRSHLRGGFTKLKQFYSAVNVYMKISK